jgi:hypothetical protein
VELLEGPLFLDFLSRGFVHFGSFLGEMVKWNGKRVNISILIEILKTHFLKFPYFSPNF